MTRKSMKTLICIGIACVSIVGCRDADIVSDQIARNADEFKVERKITVLNTRTGSAIYEESGLISVSISDCRLNVIKKEPKGVYTKDIIVLNRDSMYIIEDLEGTKIDNLDKGDVDK